MNEGDENKGQMTCWQRGTGRQAQHDEKRGSGVHATIAPPVRLGLLGRSCSCLRVHGEGWGVNGSWYGTKQKACFGMWMDFGAGGRNGTSEWRQQEWVSIAMSWDSRFGDLLWNLRLGQALDGRKRDGDAVGGLGGDVADSARDPIKVDLMVMGFGTGWMNRLHRPACVELERESDGGPREIQVRQPLWTGRGGKYYIH